MIFLRKYLLFKNNCAKSGLQIQKAVDNREILKENPFIIAKRAKFLRLLAQYRSENRYITYIDETYLQATHCVPTQWADKSNNGFRKKISKGPRLIIVNGGGKNGFVDNSLLVFKSGSKSGDYHDDMNFNNFSKWLKEHYLYHNVQAERTPTMSSRKMDMINWLKARNIPHTEKMYKSELRALILQNKPPIRYVIDEIIERAGHTTLRLPPYHPDLNPIEAIWALGKNSIAKKNVTEKLNDVRELAIIEFSKITADDWRKRCEHVQKVEELYRNAEVRSEDDHTFDQNYS